MKRTLLLFSLLFPLLLSAQNVGEGFNTGVEAWKQYSDGQYTSVLPLSVTANTWTDLPNDAATAIDFLNGTPEMYSAGKLQGSQVGDTYTVRVNFKAKSILVNNFGSIQIDIGDGITQNVILEKVFEFPRGAGIEHSFSFTIQLYTLNDFVANGGTIKYKTDTASEVYDINYLCVR